LKALLKNSEEKRLRVEQDAIATKQRLAQLEATVMGQRPQNDPLAEGLQSLRQREAVGDVEAHATLQIGREAAQTQMALQRQEAMIEAKVSPDDWKAVRNLLASNPGMDVERAKKLARAEKSDDIESENAKLKEQLAQKERELQAANNRPRVPNMAMRPAAVAPDTTKISAAEAKAILAQGGDAAKAFKARRDSPPGTPGHLEVDYSK
jgi:hypothetical protein